VASRNAACCNPAIGRKQLCTTLKDLIDVSSNEADRIISRLVSVGKLIKAPRLDFGTDDSFILGGCTDKVCPMMM
jgi:hypothetical protein